MDLEEILALKNAHIRAKEAEALAILTAQAGPASQMLEGAKRQFGDVLQVRDMGPFISPSAEVMYKQGKREATRFLFEAYARTVFPLVTDADTFISLLSAIGARVKARLSVIDEHEESLLYVGMDATCVGTGEANRLAALVESITIPLEEEPTGDASFSGQRDAARQSPTASTRRVSDDWNQ